MRECFKRVFPLASIDDDRGDAVQSRNSVVAGTPVPAPAGDGPNA